MPTDAKVVANAPGSIESRLHRILEHFGLRIGMLTVDELGAQPAGEGRRCVLFASIDAFAAAMRHPTAAHAFSTAHAVYLYADADREVSERALRQLDGWATVSLENASTGACSMSISNDLGDLDGPMAGLAVSARPHPQDFVLASHAGIPASTLLTVNGSPAFVRCELRGVAVFVCTSATMVDIDQPVGATFFDVKDHFCSLVPLAMFVTSVLRDSIWRPFEHGACVIVDDPLLKPTYGFCDFGKLLESMNRYDFTTNVAFIPWNWRRTSTSAGEFFRREGRRFSISIHGCDHTASEFGDTSVEALNAKASLAQARMQRHEHRTGIAHDAVMVFPQGVFSSQSLGVLSRNGFMAAVNTEVNPVDPPSDRTLIRDVWDVAITRYASFPIFTRRYAFHGLENFAFDILIGKPCLVVSHHEFFKNECADVIDLVRRLNALRCSLTWRSLGDVVRRSGRRRARDGHAEDIQMYGSQLLVPNPSERPLRVVVSKNEGNPSLVTAVRGDRGPLEWSVSGDRVVFADTIPAGREASYAMCYAPHTARPQSRPIRLEASVAARRILSEFRDEYWQKFVRR